MMYHFLCYDNGRGKLTHSDFVKPPGDRELCLGRLTTVVL